VRLVAAIRGECWYHVVGCDHRANPRIASLLSLAAPRTCQRSATLRSIVRPLAEHGLPAGRSGWPGSFSHRDGHPLAGVGRSHRWLTDHKQTTQWWSVTMNDGSWWTTRIGLDQEICQKCHLRPSAKMDRDQRKCSGPTGEPGEAVEQLT